VSVGEARDLVIEMLADLEAESNEQIVSLEANVRTYRDLAQAAIHELHDLTRERDRLRAAYHRLLDAYRHLRAQTMGEAYRRTA